MIEPYHYQDGELTVEGVALSALAERFGTPLYVYSRAAIEARFQAYRDALGARDHLLCYAVKANSNLAVLNILARLGAGFDIVSGGELTRVLRAGGDPGKVIFSGVGKQAEEMAQALEAGIACFNVESIPELDRLNTVAGNLGRRAPVSLRINPDVDAQTHPYISTGLKENKFGIASNAALNAYRLAARLPHLDVIGIDCHIGSQLTDLAPYLDALDRLLDLVDQLAAEGIPLRHFDLGGGLGVRYRDEVPPDPAALIDAVVKRLGNRALTLLLEPGRSIVAEAGALITRVEYVKHAPDRDFAIVDGAMNDLLRPALYSAWQKIVPVRLDPAIPSRVYDVVGPVCESADFLGKARELAVAPGDLLAVLSAGAYGFVMSSNYNTRNRAAEVMVDRDQAHLVRRRETVADQLALEHCLPD